jgi:hypothetical protein
MVLLMQHARYVPKERGIHEVGKQKGTTGHICLKKVLTLFFMCLYMS